MPVGLIRPQQQVHLSQPGSSFQEANLAPGQAAVYAYRHSSYQGSAVTLNITIDGKEIGGLKPNGYVYGIVTPGKHMVACKTESESTVEITAKPGESYYIECDVVLGFWVGRPKLTMVAPDIGRANIGGKNFCGTEAPPATQNAAPGASK